MLARSPRPRSLPALVLAAALASTGCPATPGTGPTLPGASTATVRKSPAPARGLGGGNPSAGPSTAVQAAIATLTGKVKLISDHGGGIISDNGGGIISNNGGTIISDNGGGVVSNNGANYALAAKASEALLADAVITFVDAAGRAVVGADGAPLTTRTDRQGRYALTAQLPAGNVVMKVALWDGGELAALLVRGADATTTQDVDTASSLGAAYVLERLVKGDQATLDKLPATEAGRLHSELEAARELLAGRPTYRPDALAAAAADLRGKAATVDRAITAIEALLLGQARLGDGRPATEVPLNRPTAVVVDRAGDLMIAEYGMGRVRLVGRDGRMSTLADATRGRIRSNFLYLNDLVEAPDGTLYVATNGDRAIRRVKPDGTIDEVFAEPPPRRFKILALALGADGTLYMGGGDDGRAPLTPTLRAIAPDGTVRDLPAPDGGPGVVRALATAPDGGLFVLRSGDLGATLGTLDRLAADGTATRLAADLRVHDRADLARTADGTVLVADDRGGAIEAFAPDGSRRTLAGPAAALVIPGGLGLAPDGTAYLSDHGTGLVHRRDPDGTWRVIAGVNADTAASDGRSLPLNTPIGLAFDARGRLLIAENGRHRVVRYDGGRIETVAGSTKGYGGDGGPATAATFNGIAGLAARGDEIFVLDGANNRLRRIGADGRIDTIVGPGTKPYLEGPAAAADTNVALAIGLAIDAAGRPYWANAGRHQVQRLSAPGTTGLVAGRRLKGDERGDLAELLADVVVDGEPAPGATIRFPLGIAFDPAGDLVVADAGHSMIRKITGLAGDDPRIATIAGTGPAGLATIPASGAVPATGAVLEIPLITPAGVCFDAAGNMYVGELGTTRTELMADIFADSASLDLSAFPPVPPRIRKITPDGRVTTIAGPGGAFFADPNADDALIMPSALAIAPDGRLFIADPGANLVRILPAGSF